MITQKLLSFSQCTLQNYQRQILSADIGTVEDYGELSRVCKAILEDDTLTSSEICTLLQQAMKRRKNILNIRGDNKLEFRLENLNTPHALYILSHLGDDLLANIILNSDEFFSYHKDLHKFNQYHLRGASCTRIHYDICRLINFSAVSNKYIHTFVQQNKKQLLKFALLDFTQSPLQHFRFSLSYKILISDILTERPSMKNNDFKTALLPIHKPHFSLITEPDFSFKKYIPLTLEINSEEVQNLEKAQIFGGRTLVIPTSTKNNNRYFYKFLRTEEAHETLEKEFKTLGVYQKFKQPLGLKSAIADPIGIFRIPANKNTKLDHLLSQCPDKIEQVEYKSGDSYYIVLKYMAPTHYGKFAHELNPSKKNVVKDAENGLMNYIHDIAVCSNYGVYFPNTMPILHRDNDEDNDTNKWSSMAIATRKTLAPVTSGSMTDWKETSTQFSDISFTGIRDVGDNVPEDYLNKYYRIIPLYLTPLLCYNALCDSLTTHFIVLATLHQQLPNYHHHNTKLVKHFKSIIHKSLNILTQIRTQKTLAELLELNDSEYQKWLDHTARELIYWTANQKELPCFSNDILKDQQLDPTIYKNATVDTFFTSDSFLSNGKRRLGCKTGLFPLLSLQEALFQIFIKINEHDTKVATLNQTK